MTDAPTFTAPTKSCPHCGAMSQTTQAKCPNCNKKYKKKSPVLKILLGLVLLGLLAFAGCTALVGGAANEVAKSIEESENEVGGTNNPLTIEEGKAFEVRGFNYAAGWKVVTNDFGSEIQGLKVTNNRGKSDSALVEIKFVKGTEVLALINCSTEPIDEGMTVTLGCQGDKVPAGYEKITISDAF